MSGRTLDDPILLELVKYGLEAIVDEMAIALVRTAYSNHLKNSMDLSCALCDVDGRLIAQGLTLPMHLGSIPDAMRCFKARFAGEIYPGDIYVLNDPYEGGSHLPDLYIFKPIFDDDALVGWAATVGHHADIGGMTAGGNGCDAIEIFQEGLRIPPARIYERGQPVRFMFELLERNVRVPREVIGDVRAQLTACTAGERGYLKLLHRYGTARMAQLNTALLAQAERLARTAIADMPDGVYRFEDWLDDDGITSDPIPIRVAITVAGDEMVVDFTGSSPQVKGAINSAIPFTKSGVYACVRHLIAGDPPNNEGYFRPITVIAPAGTIVNPVMPASVAARGLTGFRIANTVFGALAKIAPDRVFACESGADTGISFGGYDADRKPFVFLEFLCGSWGGRPTLDGMDASASSIVNLSNNPVELIESTQPLRIRRYGYLPDTGGPGKFRGGLALVREYQFMEAEGTLQLRTDRQKHLCYGLQGGSPGTPSRNVLNPDGAAEALPPKCRLTVRRGDVFRHVLAGAGGWGDPFTRDPSLVAADVADGKLSVQAAAASYGVVVDRDGSEVSASNTAALRAGRQGGGRETAAGPTVPQIQGQDVNSSFL